MFGSFYMSVRSFFIRLFHHYFKQFPFKLLRRILFIQKPLIKKENKESIILTTNRYIHKEATTFLSLWKNDEKRKLLNQNIEPMFYSKEEYTNLLFDESNEIELRWKRNILIETTPLGNIIMYYDCFKQGFSYYSDSNTIPYVLLNTVAMKYVLRFHCFDFFVDSNVIREKESPLLALYHKEPVKKEINESFKKKNIHFLQPKTVLIQNHIHDGVVQQQQQQHQEFTINKFIRLGKVMNFSFVQPYTKTPAKQNSLFKSKYLTDLQGETNLQMDVMNYKQYKLNMTEKVKQS